MKVHTEPVWVQSLPNLLTGLRVVLTPVIVCLMLWDGVFSNQLAAIFFGVAAISDVLDGFFARRHGSGSQLISPILGLT